MLLAEGFDFDIHSCRKIELHQRIDRLRRWVEYVHQPLVSANLELLARFFIDVRAAQHGVFVLDRRKRDRPRNTRPRALGSVYDLSSRLIKHSVIISLEANSYFLIQHASFSVEPHFSAPLPQLIYSMISEMVPAPTVRPPSLIANLNPFSIAIGAINSISIVMLSPGITISTPSGNFAFPVTSVVRK